MKRLQLTLAVFKPDVTANPLIVKEIKDIILENGFLFIRSKGLQLSTSRAEEFYKEHKGKFFYNRLVSFMASGPISAHILARRDGIAQWRSIMGPTKVFRTLHEFPNTIRGRFGLTDTRNCTHGSDSEDSARNEMGFFFPEFSTEDWYEKEEQLFQNKTVKYDEKRNQHFVDFDVNKYFSSSR